jgi:hypothetical protein
MPMLMRRRVTLTVALVIACAGGCARNPTPRAPDALPSRLIRAVVLVAADDPDYPRADEQGAVKAPGEGNVSRAIVVRLTQDVPVFRLWNGPDVVDANGHTNRIGSWWTFEPPRGSVQRYRRDYAVCLAWNRLAWVAACTLKKGAVVAVGPGNSVSSAACGDETGREHYPPNGRRWQLYVARPLERTGPEKELDCSDESRDYAADPRDVARRR